MHRKIEIAFRFAAAAALISCGAFLANGFAQSSRSASEAGGSAGTLTTSADFPRGAEQIYMIKCWMCHNEFAKTGPPLKDLAKRPKLISGEPVNEKTVSEKIKAGSQRMPSYRYSLSDQQLAELVSYLLGGKCCPNPDNPPPNPQYRKPS